MNWYRYNSVIKRCLKDMWHTENCTKCNEYIAFNIIPGVCDTPLLFALLRIKLFFWWWSDGNKMKNQFSNTRLRARTHTHARAYEEARFNMYCFLWPRTKTTTTTTKKRWRQPRYCKKLSLLRSHRSLASSLSSANFQVIWTQLNTLSANHKIPLKNVDASEQSYLSN